MTTAPKEQEPLITEDDLAAYLDVSSQTVARWAQAGLVPSVRLPKQSRRYLMSEVLAALKSRETR